MELCAEKLERLDRELTESDCVFTFNRVHFQSVLRLKRSGCDSVLVWLSEWNWIQFSTDQNEITIKMPMLLDLLDYDSKKSRTRRAPIAHEKRLESESDIESESERDIKATSLFELWNQHCSPFSKANIFTTTRRTKSKSQLAKYPDLKHWHEVLARWKSSEFCLTKWKPNFDDFLNEGKRISTLEGKYNNRTESPEQTQLRLVREHEEYQKRQAEIYGDKEKK